MLLPSYPPRMRKESSCSTTAAPASWWGRLVPEIFEAKWVSFTPLWIAHFHVLRPWCRQVTSAAAENDGFRKPFTTMKGWAGTIHDSKNRFKIPILEWFWIEILIHWLYFRFKSRFIELTILKNYWIVPALGYTLGWFASQKMRRDKMPCRVFLCEPTRRFATSSAHWSLRTGALTGFRCPNFKAYFP